MVAYVVVRTTRRPWARSVADMNTSRTDCDVLVVGAGPTGLTLAAQLLARGIRTKIIDKTAGAPVLSRAIGIQPLTLELLESMGVLDRFLAAGHRVRRVRLYSGSRSLIGVDLAHSGSAHHFALHLPQHRTEQFLGERVAELGGVIDRGTELVDFVEDGDVITATVRDGAGCDRVVSAGYLAGCDGAHSKVRTVLGVPFTGQPYPWNWVLADVRVDWEASSDEVHVMGRRDGLMWACVPITGDLWRVSIPQPSRETRRPPTLADVQELVQDGAPMPMRLHDPETLINYRCQLRSTPTYRKGRVLLAGDAAHIHSPAGGQGMNTGMADAANLGWKLALVAAGRAPDALLDSYVTERRPVAADVMAFSDRLVGFATITHPIKRFVRTAALPAFGLRSVQRRIAGRMSQVAVSYRHSPLNGPDVGRGGPRPGQRVANIEVTTATGPRPLLGVLASGTHVLVLARDAAALGVPDGFVTVVRGRLGTAEAFLVRPDGYLAARGSLAAVRDHLRNSYGPAHTQASVRDVRGICLRVRGGIETAETGCRPPANSHL